jgi:hypothetical protein
VRTRHGNTVQSVKALRDDHLQLRFVQDSSAMVFQRTLLGTPRLIFFRKEVKFYFF